MPDYVGSLTVADIIARVKTQFGDQDGSQINDENIKRWINDAMANIAVNNDLLQKRATNSVSIGEWEISIPPDVITINTLRVDGVKLIELNTKEWDDYISNDASQSGLPTHYSRWSNVLNLYPRPSKVVELTLLYTRHPIKVVELTDVPEIPHEYHQRILEFCLAQAFELDSDPTNSALKMQQFNEGVSNTKNTSDWRGRDVYPSITVGLDDMGYGVYGSGY